MHKNSRPDGRNLPGWTAVSLPIPPGLADRIRRRHTPKRVPRYATPGQKMTVGQFHRHPWCPDELCRERFCGRCGVSYLRHGAEARQTACGGFLLQAHDCEEGAA